tara:strand:+ start:210 stop:1292 length:1083 start_codon:yes stop_codon:yes gene_type:complete
MAAYSPSLAYPLESDPVYNTRIRFSTYKVKPVSPGRYEGLGTGLSSLLKDNVGKFVNTITAPGSVSNSMNSLLERFTDGEEDRTEVDQQELEQKKKDQAEQVSNSVLSTFSGYATSIDTTSPVISMYIPLSMTFNDNIMYDNANLGAAGAVLGKTLEEGSGIMTSLGKAMFEGVSNTTDVLLNGLGSQLDKGAGRLALQRAINAASQVPGVPQGLGSTATLALQTSVNPNTRALFKGVALREFSFQFQFHATSAQESQEIEKIINHFRTKMYPEVYDPFSDKTNIPFAYNFPHIFKINFKLGNTDIKVPRIDFCYLRNCQVVYNPTGATFHKDGYANEISMTLSFMEYKTMSKQDIERGY